MAKWTEKRPDEDFYRVLGPDGELDGEPPAFDDDRLRRMYEVIVQTRAFEAKVFRMQRRGELSIMAETLGEEAASLGSAMALEAGDWCYPSYRQTAGLFYHGVPMDRFIARLMGYEPETTDEHLPIADGDEPPVNFVTGYVPLAVNVANAAGSAMVDGFRDDDTVTMAYIGDGATSEGDFYEGMNFAGVFDAPLVVICQNNQWAISVPAHRQTAAETFARKSEAVGIPNERVDGNDVFAVYEKTREAVERARDGGGPTFIELVTYRIPDHNTADEDSVYRDEEEVAYWKARDPLDRLEAYLREEGVLDAEQATAIEEAVAERIERAVATARDVPSSDPELMFEHHLHGDSWSERHQRAQLRAELRGANPFTDVPQWGSQ